MPITRKQITGRIRTLFYLAAIGVIGSQMVAHHVIAPIADKTDHVADTLGVTPQRLQAIAGSKFHVFFNDDVAAPFFRLAFVPDMTEVNFFAKSHLNGEAWQNLFFGHGSNTDTLSRGLTGKIFPCTVMLPSSDTPLNDFRESFSHLDSRVIEHVPGTAKDYYKLLVYHELAHCSHLTRHPERRINEYLADRQAIDAYLEDNGNPDVVRAWLYARIIKSNQFMILNSDPADRKNNPYTFAGILLDHYFGSPKDTVTVDLLNERHAEEQDAAAWLWARARQDLGMGSHLLKGKTMPHFIYRTLNDPSVSIPPATRRILEHNDQAYRFFATPRAPRPEPQVF